MIVSAIAKTNPCHKDFTHSPFQQGSPVHEKVLAARDDRPLCSDDSSGSSESDCDSQTDEDGISSGDEPGRSSKVKWDPLDELHLLAYRKEGKPWKWILRKFPNRTEPAVRTRLSMINKNQSR